MQKTLSRHLCLTEIYRPYTALNNYLPMLNSCCSNVQKFPRRPLLTYCNFWWAPKIGKEPGWRDKKPTEICLPLQVCFHSTSLQIFWITHHDACLQDYLVWCFPEWTNTIKFITEKFEAIGINQWHTDIKRQTSSHTYIQLYINPLLLWCSYAEVHEKLKRCFK